MFKYEKTYAHKIIDTNKFIFQITGLKLNKNTVLDVGHVKFVEYDYLINNIIDEELTNSLDFYTFFTNTKTFAVIDLNLFGDCHEFCKQGLNSLALQILKQTIGILYISIYNNYKTKFIYDAEKRIVISDNGVNEVDEGLNSYMFMRKNKYCLYPQTVNKQLIASIYDLELQNIESILSIMKKNIESRNEYESKICKSLEIIYSIFNENSSRERVIKWPIILNYLFREDGGDININFITKRLKTIFDIISPQEILASIPSYLIKNLRNTDKIHTLVEDIYREIRNKTMHGHIELYEEYTTCNVENIIIFKVVTLELINILCNHENLTKCTTTKELNEYIKQREKEFSKMKRLNNKK